MRSKVERACSLSRHYAVDSDGRQDHGNHGKQSEQCGREPAGGERGIDA